MISEFAELIGRYDLTTREYDRMMDALVMRCEFWGREDMGGEYFRAWLLAERSHHQVTADLGIRVSPADYEAMTNRYAKVEALLA